MITDFVVSWFGRFVGWLGGLVSLPDPPAFLGTLAGYVQQAAGYVASTGAWMPWGLLLAVIAAYAACLTAGVVVKLARIVASFLTAGGGSAA